MAPLLLLTGASALCLGQGKIGKATDPTGHYRYKNGTTVDSLEAQVLPGQRVKLDLVALWVSPNNPDNVHNGELTGVVPLRHNEAVLDPDACKVHLRFTGSKAVVKADGSPDACGFGANVTADGTYARTDHKKPKFDF